MHRPASSTAPASPARAGVADPRTEFDRLAALRHMPGPLPREPWVALAELAAVPDFDVDLLQPWRAACAAALAPPRSLREEAARSSGCARCLALLKAAPPGKDWALAVIDDAAPKMQGRWVERLRGERLLLLGLQALDEGRRGQAREAVRAGLEIHFAQPHPAPLDQLDGPMARVAAVGLALGTRADALRALIAQRQLAAPPEADEHGPWTPRLQLFDGWRAEGLVAAPGEARQEADSKPLQILQMLAATPPPACRRSASPMRCGARPRATARCARSTSR